MSGENFFWALVGGGLLNIIWNLIAHYITPFTDRVLGVISKRYKRFSKERQERVDHRVERMIADPHEVTRVYISEATYYQATLVWLVMWVLAGTGLLLSARLDPASRLSPEVRLIIVSVVGIFGMTGIVSKRLEARAALGEYYDWRDKSQEE